MFSKMSINSQTLTIFQTTDKEYYTDVKNIPSYKLTRNNNKYQHPGRASILPYLIYNNEVHIALGITGISKGYSDLTIVDYGGRCDVNETLYQTAIRELDEESSSVLSNMFTPDSLLKIKSYTRNESYVKSKNLNNMTPNKKRKALRMVAKLHTKKSPLQLITLYKDITRLNPNNETEDMIFIPLDDLIKIISTKEVEVWYENKFKLWFGLLKTLQEMNELKINYGYY